MLSPVLCLGWARVLGSGWGTVQKGEAETPSLCPEALLSHAPDDRRSCPRGESPKHTCLPRLLVTLHSTPLAKASPGTELLAGQLWILDQRGGGIGGGKSPGKERNAGRRRRRQTGAAGLGACTLRRGRDACLYPARARSPLPARNPDSSSKTEANSLLRSRAGGGGREPRKLVEGVGA